MIPVILKGDTSAQIALSIGEGFPLSGCTLLADFCGIRREFHDVVSGGNVTLAFSADETACFPLGTSKVMFSMRNAAGDVRTFPWRKIKVTDSPADVCDAAITIDPATLEVETLPARFNDEDVRSRLDAVIRWLTRTASVVALLALPVFGATVDVQTAPKGRIYNDGPVVTNVVFDVSDMATTGAVAAAVATAREYTDAAIVAAGSVTPGVVTNIVRDMAPAPDFTTGNAQLVATIAATAPAPDLSTNNAVLVETIEATAPAPGDYAAVSNAAMNALSRAEAEAGFTEWVVTPSEYDGMSLHIEWVCHEFDGSIFQGWAIVDSDGEERAVMKDYPTATNLVWGAGDTSIGAASATRTRLPTMADIPTKPEDIGAAATADATLTPVYSQTPTFGEWTFNRYNVELSEPLLTSEGLWGYHFSGDELNSDADQKFSSEAEALVATELTTATAYGITVTATRERTDIRGYRLGPDTSGNPNRDKPIAALDAVPPTVANIVRDLSLGGIWDEALQVWWTPRMRSGSLTYEATTNVNLNAEN